MTAPNLASGVIALLVLVALVLAVACFVQLRRARSIEAQTDELLIRRYRATLQELVSVKDHPESWPMGLRAGRETHAWASARQLLDGPQPAAIRLRAAHGRLRQGLFGRVGRDLGL
jgi:hypothetical protein